MKFQNNYNIFWMYVVILCMFDNNYRNGKNTIYRIFQVEWHSFGTHCTMFRVLTGIWVKTTLCDNVKVQVIFSYILWGISSYTLQCSYFIDFVQKYWSCYRENKCFKRRSCYCKYTIILSSFHDLESKFSIIHSRYASLQHEEICIL